MSESEKEILKFWKENKIFSKSVALRQAQGKKDFVFFEGPPTANGKPGVHHIETRAFKDAILRYKTMRGFSVPRVAGWDTHGLPVEVQVEKELGLKSKKDIVSYGVSEFNKKCRESVWKYKELWENLTERMGFWIDMENAYVTYENSYIEKLWGIIKKFHENKLLYEDLKVLPWCARCGTALSSQEVAQGYQKVKEDSFFVKFKSKNFDNTYFLAWTTTPWTLPGNVALAVNPDIDYVFSKIGEEIFIIAEARLEILGGNYEIIKKAKGKDLVGQEYEPLYKNNAPYKIIGGDFVLVGDGSGIVHIAPAFGDDDFQVGKKNDLPVFHTTNEKGEMVSPGFLWDGQFFKKADSLIKENLKNRGLVFAELSYEHDYPFCWRCKTPLMYFARKAWWVDVNKVRKNLLKNNEQINWHPDYLKHGRFGEWLKEEKNWAFSRERFWGTPLPVWKCADCGKLEVPGSVDELKEKSVPRNNFIFMRHGEADHNVRGISGPWEDTAEYTSVLTNRGKKEVEDTADALKIKIKKIDIIISSTLARAKATAKIVEQKFGGVDIVSRKDLVDINSAGETKNDVKKRMELALGDIDSEYERKNILVISHGDPLWILGGEEAYPETGKIYNILWHPEPVDESGNLDLHKPYIDSVFMKCKCGGLMARTPEVVDVWFDSGSMPFASNPPGYPADYIVEAIDQTRGWFYSLLAVSTLLGKSAPYKNVISTGHLLDAKGKKMSKSSGNVVDPMELMEKYGADAVRWYFFTINQPWDSKLFKEEDIKDAQRRFFVILENVASFLKMYSGNDLNFKIQNSKLIINQWVIAALNQLTNNVTHKLDGFDIVGAARDIEYFVTEDISRWYVRRIRDVMKKESPEKIETQNVLKFVLLETCKLLAPLAPFISEKIYKELGGEKESIHLEDFPEAGKVNEKLLDDMVKVRKNVSFVLEARAKAGIKVRQPLQDATVIGEMLENQELVDLIKEETNVKKVDFGNKFELNTEITPELKEEGLLRDLVRGIQSARKVAGLKPGEIRTAKIIASQETLNVFKKYEPEIKKETSINEVELTVGDKINISL
ncbi:MAG: class I tRNA ligase family protein [Patescibacteria group bacterium]